MASSTNQTHVGMVVVARNRLATASRHNNVTPDEMDELRRDLTAAKVEVAIQDALAARPKLDETRRARLAFLLMGGEQA